MDVAFRVEQNVVWLDVSVDNALLVYVAHGATELGYPKAHGVFCEGLARDVEAQITAVHEIDDNVPGVVSVVSGASGARGYTGIQCPGSCSAGCRETGG